jgi:hypothetical protein
MVKTTFEQPEPSEPREPEHVPTEEEATQEGLGRYLVRMPGADGETFETIGDGAPLIDNE